MHLPSKYIVHLIESIFESFLQLGLSFYILNHHGLDEPKFTNIPGEFFLSTNHMNKNSINFL